MSTDKLMNLYWIIPQVKLNVWYQCSGPTVCWKKCALYVETKKGHVEIEGVDGCGHNGLLCSRLEIVFAETDTEDQEENKQTNKERGKKQV